MEAPFAGCNGSSISKKELGPKRYTSELVLNKGKQTNHIIYASELVLK